MSDSFVKNVSSGKISGRIMGNAVSNMIDALFLVAVDASRRAPIGPARQLGGRLRANVDRYVFSQGGVIHGEFIFRQPYAEKQHEGLNFNHPRGGEAKFAERAIRENVDNVMKVLAKGLMK